MSLHFVLLVFIYTILGSILIVSKIDLGQLYMEINFLKIDLGQLYKKINYSKSIRGNFTKIITHLYSHILKIVTIKREQPD